MLRRLIAASAALAALICVAVAFVQFSALQQIFPFETNYILQIKEEPRDRTEFLAGLAALGDSHGVVVLLGVPDPENFLGKRVFYSLAANQPTAATDVRFLDPSLAGELHPVGDLGLARLSGYYSIKANEGSILALKQWLKAASIEVTWSRETPLKIAQSQMVLGGLALSLVAVAMMGAIAAMAWYSAKAESRAVRVLAGELPRRIHARDFLQFAMLLSAPLVIVLLSGLVAAGIWRGWDNAILLAVPSASYVAIWLALVLGSGLILSLRAVPAPEEIANRVPHVVRFSFVSQLLQIVSVGLTVAIVPALLLATSIAFEKSRVQSLIAPLRGQLSVTLDYDPGADMEQKLQEEFIRIVSQGEAAGNVMLGAVLPTGDASKMAEYDGIVVVNQAYVDAMLSSAVVLRPVRDVESAAAFATIRGVFSKGALPSEGGPIRILEGASGLVVQSAGGGGGFVALSQPLIVEVASVSRDITPSAILSLLTMENITFRDYDSLAAAVRSEPNASAVLRGVQRVTDSELQYAQFLYRSAVAMSFALVVLGGSVLLCLRTATSIYAIRHARRVFIMRVAGASWKRILARRLMGEALATLLTLGVVCLIYLAFAGVFPWWAVVTAGSCFVLTAAMYTVAVRWVFGNVANRQH